MASPKVGVTFLRRKVAVPVFHGVSKPLHGRRAVEQPDGALDGVRAQAPSRASSERSERADR